MYILSSTVFDTLDDLDVNLLDDDADLLDDEKLDEHGNEETRDQLREAKIHGAKGEECEGESVREAAQVEEGSIKSGVNENQCRTNNGPRGDCKSDGAEHSGSAGSKEKCVEKPPRTEPGREKGRPNPGKGRLRPSCTIRNLSLCPGAAPMRVHLCPGSPGCILKMSATQS